MSPDWPWLVVLVARRAAGTGPSLPLRPRGQRRQRPGPARAGDGPGARSCCSRRSAISSALLLWMHLRAPWWTWSWPLWSYAVLCVVSGTRGLAARLASSSSGAGVPRGSTEARPRRSTWPSRRRRDALIGTGRRLLAAAAARQRVVPACSSASGTWRSRACPTALDGLQHRPDQRPPPRSLLRPPVLRGRDRRLPRLEGRPGRHHRRPGRGRRGDRLDRAARSSPLRGPAGQVRDPGQPRRRASTADDRRRARRAPGFEILEGRWTTLDARRDDAGDRRDVRPVGAGLRPRATCRRPTSASCFSHSPDLFYKAAALGHRPDALRTQPRRPDPAPAGRPRLHAQPLLATVRPRLLPHAGRTCCTSARASRQAPGPLRLLAGDRPARPAARLHGDGYDSREPIGRSPPGRERDATGRA